MSTVLNTHNDYTVAWVCALPLEAVAVKAVLDKTHPPLPQPVGDDNAYELGEISGHNIVIVYLPAGVYGTTSAATVVAQLRTSFPSIRFALLVGIGGGVPSARHDIRLGDVVVSQPTDIWGGVVQYDCGKAISGTFQRTGMMNQPPQILLTAIARLRTGEIGGHNPKITEIVLDLLNTNAGMKSQCPRPAEEQDRLFNAAYNHQEGEETCAKCDQRYLLSRDSRLLDGPQVHYGLIASGNQVMKDGQTRDRLAKDIGILCFEMEAAGLMNQISCLVIRGICDYSDSHKNKHWQGYAALTGAVYGKVLLSIVPVNQYRRDQAEQPAGWFRLREIRGS